ncbi:MAG: ferrous iron transporter B [Clostridia bacterium]|nr:ferrous iron transporter B [Clostridia bacterium]
MRIALTGNPNSGKTTMYNALTGRNEKVGNWAGVTVDKKESPIKKSFHNGNEELIAVDLPGAYSMSPFTSEESITSSYVKDENPDAIINIVDATNLSRSLFFTTQLLELGIPVVVALNKSDINAKKENKIDTKALSEKLGCPVVETISTSSNGLKEVIKVAVSLKGKTQIAPYSQGDINLSDKAEVEASDRNRFDFVNKIVSEVEIRKVVTNKKNKQDKIDEIITNKWLGIPLFAIVMWAVFFISQSWLGPMIADFLVAGIEAFGGVVEGWMAGSSSEFLKSLVSSAIIDGVGAVVGFLPLVMVMYFMIALLEDCGYMARATVVLDPIFKKVGLSGKSVIPFVIGTGCAIPGVMACRTIRNERERRATAMLAPFMPCGAKLPVIALFVGVFFPNSSWISTAMYFAGIVIILLCALLINKITCYKHRKSFFIIELPEYKVPSIWRAVKSMCSRGWAYIVKAGTIILVCNVIVTLMSSFTPALSAAAEDGSDSILAVICSPVDWLLIPIVGFASWKLVACAVTGFIAKENVVGTIATLFGLTAVINGDLEVVGESKAVMDALRLTPMAALAYMMFNLFTPPCFAAMGAMNSEMKSKKWLFGGIGLQLAVGFTVGYLVYQIGSIITTGTLAAGFIPGLIAILVIAAIIIAIIVHNQKKFKAEYEMKKKQAAAK